MALMSVKRFAKVALAKVADNLGIFRALESSKQTDGAIILMYHRVLESIEQEVLPVQPGMYVTRETFRMHAHFLKKHYQVLPLTELLHRYKNQESLRGCCAITFDDGWQDNFQHAFPVLQEFELPATIFLATGFIGTEKLFWTDEIALYLSNHKMSGNENNEVFSSHLRDFLVCFQSFSTKPLLERIDILIAQLKSLSPDQRADILDYFRQQNPVEAMKPVMLSWEQVSEMMQSGLVTFGGHTVNHELLDQLSAERVERELLQCYEQLDSFFGSRPLGFAYPNGNYNKSVRSAVSQTGYQLAFTTQRGRWQASTPLMEIPRIGIHEDVSRTPSLFHARLLLRYF